MLLEADFKKLHGLREIIREEYIVVERLKEHFYKELSFPIDSTQVELFNEQLKFIEEERERIIRKDMIIDESLRLLYDVKCSVRNILGDVSMLQNKVD